MFAQLQARLGLEIRQELLELAFTHRSFAYENGLTETNERLEFLGDSVLGLVVTEELYAYSSNPEIPEEEAEDQLLMDGDVMNLEAPIRDAIVLALPINPVCDEECEGLCPECGEKWAELPADHAHEQIDARWGALKGLLEPEADGK